MPKAQGFKSLRYDEDYTYLAKDSGKRTFYDKLKYVSFNRSKTVFATFGGEVRYQYGLFRNEEWGDSEDDKAGFLLLRHMVHADWHAGRHFRIFSQLKANFELGRNEGPRIPIDEDRLSLHQLFADAVFTLTPGRSALKARIGRQELMYGSQRLIATREGPNNRQNFDALKLFYTTPAFQLDVFYANPIQNLPGVWDDKRREDIDMLGAYAVFNKLPFIGNADVYIISLVKQTARFNDGSAKEDRYSIGTRVWNRKGRWRYDGELVYQVGQFGTNNVNAWTASINADYTFAGKKIKPVVGLKTEIISGDQKKGDNKLQTFNPLFPRGAYFGFPALVGPANLIDVHPSLSIPLSKVFKINAEYNLFWRHQTSDGLYGPAGNFIRSDNGSESYFIGHQTTAQFEYQPNKFFFSAMELAYFKAGNYLKESGNGKNVFIFNVTTTFKF